MTITYNQAARRKIDLLLPFCRAQEEHMEQQGGGSSVPMMYGGSVFSQTWDLDVQDARILCPF